MQGHCTPFTQSTYDWSCTGLQVKFNTLNSKRLTGHCINGQTDHCAEQDAS